MWNLVPRPGIKPRPPALGAQILSLWITRKVPKCTLLTPLEFKVEKPGVKQMTTQMIAL